MERDGPIRRFQVYDSLHGFESRQSPLFPELDRKDDIQSTPDHVRINPEDVGPEGERLQAWRVRLGHLPLDVLRDSDVDTGNPLLRQNLMVIHTLAQFNSLFLVSLDPLVSCRSRSAISAPGNTFFEHNPEHLEIFLYR